MNFLDKLKSLLGLNRQAAEVIILDNNEIVISQDRQNVIVTINTIQEVVFINQTAASIKALISNNYQTVREYYRAKSVGIVQENDLNDICLEIVIKHLHMYNMWRSMYKKERERNLRFLSTDFTSSSSSDEIIRYLKKKYPERYSRQCQALLDLTPDEFKVIEERRNNYLNK
jgi:hypothetical protein